MTRRPPNPPPKYEPAPDGFFEQEAVSLGHAVTTRVTERAVQVALDDGRVVWIPKSQLAEGGAITGGRFDVGELRITQWFAEKEGLTNGDD